MEEPNNNQACATPAQEGLMWQPGNIKNHQITLLRNQINSKYNLNLENYHQFHEWSCKHYDLFWSEIWDFCEVISSQKAECVIDTKISMDKIPKWFSGAKMNYAENLLR